MHDLLVHFEFLCAIVPERPFYLEDGEPNPKPPKKATVLLCDLRKPARTFVNSTSGEKMRPHIPHLQFDQRDRPKRGGNRAKNRSDNGNKHIIIFRREDITIHPDGGEPASRKLNPIIGKPTNKERPVPGNEEEEKLLWWTAAMDRVEPSRGIAKKKLVKGTETHEPPLAARIHLSEGTLSAGKSRTSNSWVLGSNTQQLALDVTLRLSFEKFVELRFKEFSSGKTSTLRLRPREGESSIDIHIRNSEEEHLFGDQRESLGRDDLDFEHYYDLMTSTLPKLNALPKIPKPATEGSGSHAACSPVLFLGVQQ